MQFAIAFKCSIKYDFHQIKWNLCQNSQIINTLAIKYTPGRTPAHPMPSISARKRQFLGEGKSG